MMDVHGISVFGKKVAWVWVWIAGSVAALAVNAFVAFQFSDAYYAFLTNYISSDGQIDEQPILLRTSYSLVELLLVVLLAPRLWETWSTKDRRTMLLTWVPVLLLLIPSLFWRASQVEDGIFEWFTFWAAFAAGILFLAGGFKKHSVLLIMFAFVWLVFGFEEISWGQRVIGWETPEGLEALNYQDETNLHNVLNPILVYAWPIALLTLWLGLTHLTSTVSRFLPGRMGTDLHRVARAAQNYGFVDIPLWLAVVFPLRNDYTEQCLGLFGFSLALAAWKALSEDGDTAEQAGAGASREAGVIA
jgi:hypothetical protein